MIKIDVYKDQIIKFCTQYTEFQALKAQEKQQIVTLLDQIVQWYNNQCSLSGFLAAVVSNDFMVALTRADLTSIRCIKLFAHFIGMYLPSDYIDKSPSGRMLDYLVIWHTPNPKITCANGSAEASKIALEIRKKHNMFAVSIAKEIQKI